MAQAGGFGVIALDLCDIPSFVLRQIPASTWLRLQRAVEGRDTVMVMLGAEPITRSAGGVETATVLVTNPTHFAVALRYDPERDAAPMVVGKAVEDAALAMRTRARKRGIPIVENRPLARSLHKSSKVGRPVPVEFYRAVAEVIAHVMRLRGAGASA